MRVDAILLAWPLAAVALEFAGVPDRGLRIAIAAGIAAAFAGVAAGRASGEDDARMRLLIVSALIVGYAVLRNITRPTLDSCAIVAASIAAAVPLAVVAGGGLVLPDRHRVAVGFASAACAGVGAALGAGFYLHSHFF
ncbi:hypothetical protein [Metallibacterium scheffleri]|nr:hypothetical protein [Metallibacterium scheffleri]